jgi:cytochrome c biogenesis protein ResB
VNKGGYFLVIAYGLVVITLVAAVFGTLALTTKSDENYNKAIKRNTFRLTSIYIVVIIFSLIGLAWYITEL